ncbi:dipeptidase E [Crossiella equi]|uniref:Dipeptidase E n=2 Tax=Crossiella equi TaxID=130796 RepID=A0ABS5A8R9_9PSEU|nr:Type 1 glutamine amidotransferase-like domain-containing protein [Crossiella equi]MBP2472980.1 dipeptidase E [Crossiella equi]
MPDTGFLALGGGWWHWGERELFTELFAGAPKVLYWPFALAPDRHPGLTAHLAECLRPFGVTELTTWSTVDGHGAAELGAFPVVFLGGGNSYALRRELRRNAFDTALAGYVGAGGRVYGGSAGAVVLGKDIRTDQESPVGPPQPWAGLDLVHGHAIAVHPAEDPGPLREFARTHGMPVLAVPDEGGAVVTAEGIRGVGRDPLRHYDP